MRQFFLIVCILYSALPLHCKTKSGLYTNPDMDELRIELEDVKHALKITQVDLGLLEERLKKQDNTVAGIKGQSNVKELNSLSMLSAQVNGLEKKISSLEKTLEKAANDLRALSSASTQAIHKIQELEQNFLVHEKRLDEIVQLKGTLTNISKAISQRTLTEAAPATKSYRVKAGDSLEKIARSHHLSVETLKKINNIPNDKIIIGQELRLPDGPS